MLLFTGCYGNDSLDEIANKNTRTNCLVQTGFVLVYASRGESNFPGVDIYICKSFLASEGLRSADGIMRAPKGGAVAPSSLYEFKKNKGFVDTMINFC